ncbi:unnamed protein product [Paramecium pentaurelia]|uniref:Protein kinase domain-containing protein n=1 Tax=Paramecium pentaurelia TaxID=43138 RepID=A0A8S1U4G8_9CILI|nr:unnamed protein product [Paramecium pentaurelia]
MYSPNLIIPKFQSHSGEFFLMEESNDSLVFYFALQLSNQYKKDYLQIEREKRDLIQKSRSLRHFLKMIEIKNKYYLFRYIDGNTVQEKIDINRTKQETIDQKIIEAYLIQLLEALFQLHQLNILGRIFSVENIINNNGTLVLMDFGYGPDLLQNNMNILAPPEIITKLVNENHQFPYLNYDALKFDSWLLGAFLFNLVKLRPINSIEKKNSSKKMEIFKYSNLINYQSYIEEQSKINTHIIASTSRYNESLINLIHGLLTYNCQKRLSFLEIYQSDYITKLNLPNQQQYIEFYKNFNQAEIIENLMIRDGISSSFLLNTYLLNDINKNQGKQEQIDNDFKNQQIDLTKSSPQKLDVTQVTPQDQNQNFSEAKSIQLPYIASFIEDSKYYDIWIQINLEQFRYFILNDTANQIKSEYPQENYQLSLIVQYALKKQSYLVIQELYLKLKSVNYPWKIKQVNNWSSFQMENKFHFLKHSLIEAINKLVESLAQIQKEISLNLEAIQKFLSEQNKNKDLNQIVNKIIGEKIYFEQDQSKDSLYLFYAENYQNTQENSENNNDDCENQQLINSENKNQLINDKQQEEWFTEFKMLINDIFQFFKNKINDRSSQLEYSKIILKILYCRLINKIFSFENMKYIFKNIKRYEQQIITPDDIYWYIESKDNQEQKFNDIEEIVKKYFPKQK